LPFGEGRGELCWGYGTTQGAFTTVAPHRYSSIRKILHLTALEATLEKEEPA
jgi:hypothetical protein